jgi:hypothetical protein
MWLSTRRRFAVVLVRGMTTWWLTSDPHRVRLHHRASRPQFTTHTPHAPRSSARSSAATMLSALKSARLPSFGPQSPSRMARRASASRHGNLVRPKRCERRAVRWDRPASTRGSREACAKKLFDQRERGARGSRRLRCSSAGASDGGCPAFCTIPPENHRGSEGTEAAQRSQRNEGTRRTHSCAQSGLDLGRDFSPFPAPALVEPLRHWHGSIDARTCLPSCLLCASSVPAHFGLGLCGSLGDLCRILY